MGEVARRSISSPSNARVKHLVSLRKPRDRMAAGVVLVDGHAELRLAVAAGSQPLSVYVCAQLIRDKSQLELLEQLGEVEVVELSRAAFDKASLRESPDGWLAVVPTPERPLDRIQLSRRPLVLVCESVEKPGNLGAMVRTAEAAGVDCVVAASPATDWGNPNVVRASKGTVFAVPVASAPSGDVARWLHSHRFHAVVADPAANVLVTDADLTQRPLAVVVGSEHAGIHTSWAAEGASSVRLPLLGRVNSLNVSVAAGVVLYEALRQRPPVGSPRNQSKN